MQGYTMTEYYVDTPDPHGCGRMTSWYTDLHLAEIELNRRIASFRADSRIYEKME
jgi:creatinine amidohydrolase/Fe(II)-dependent formamide hydrolase-like protein